MSRLLTVFCSLKARSFPSRDHDVGSVTYGVFVSCSAVPEPSAFFQKTFQGPGLVDRYVTRFPSGVQIGIALLNSVVTCFRLFAAMSYTKIWGLSPVIPSTTRFPSGERRGCSYAFGGAFSTSAREPSRETQTMRRSVELMFVGTYTSVPLREMLY